MKPEKAYRRQAIVALNFISVHALARKEDWKGSKQAFNRVQLSARTLCDELKKWELAHAWQ